MTNEDKETVIRLLKIGMSPRKISNNTPFPYEFVKAEYEKNEGTESE